MNKEHDFLNRKWLSHIVDFSFEAHPIVFLTVCTKDKKPALANDEAYQELISLWRDASQWRVGTYVLMPDHLHLLVQWNGGKSSFIQWVHYWKTKFRLNYSDKTFRWQKGCFDHRIRHLSSYEEKKLYIQQNPMRRGLIGADGAWRYGGEIYVLDPD